jgi:peptide/nickel transport system permease protein
VSGQFEAAGATERLDWTGIVGPSLGTVLGTVAITSVPVFARLTRGQVGLIRNLDYVLAARSLGASPERLIATHILPNVYSPILVQACLTMSTALLVEAGLSFLGLGVQPPTPTWGGMLSVARGFLQRAPWFALAPGAALTLAVLAFNLSGDLLRDHLDPRLHGARLPGPVPMFIRP